MISWNPTATISLTIKGKIMTIQHLPMPVIDNFLNGDPCAIGPFRSDGKYLYLDNNAIAYRDKSGKVFRMQQPSATPPEIDYGAEFLKALCIALPFVGLFFWFLFSQFGGA